MQSSSETVKTTITPQIKTARGFFGVSDLYVLGFVVSGFVGVAGFSVSPALAAPALALAGYIAYNYLGRRKVALAAANVASNAWVAHYPSDDLHTPAGEKVSVVKFEPDASYVTVSFEDGKTLRYKPDELRSSEGVYLKSATPDYPALPTLRRWSTCRWKTDDGRIGILREVRSYSVSSDVTGTQLLLKFEDGKSERIDIRDLTPVPAAPRDTSL